MDELLLFEIQGINQKNNIIANNKKNIKSFIFWLKNISMIYIWRKQGKTLRLNQEKNGAFLEQDKKCKSKELWKYKYNE